MATQTLARVALEGDAIDLRVYAPCTPIAAPAMAGACSVALPPDLEEDLAGASEAPHLTETVRLASDDGSSLVESAAISARWSSMALSGALYFWSSPPTTGGTASQLVRQNLDVAGSPPAIYMQNADLAPLDPSFMDCQPCFGCHAISQDGTKMALTIGGSDLQGTDSQFALMDVATKQALASGGQTAVRLKDNNASFKGFAVFSTFSPDGMHLVQSLQGQLLPRAADATLADEGGPLFAGAGTEPALTMPFWSAKGDLFAFVGYTPAGSPAVRHRRPERQRDRGRADLDGPRHRNHLRPAEAARAARVGRERVLPRDLRRQRARRLQRVVLRRAELAGRGRLRGEPVRRLRRPLGAAPPGGRFRGHAPSSSIARAGAPPTGPRAERGPTRGRAGRRRTGSSRARTCTGWRSRPVARTGRRWRDRRTARRSPQLWFAAVAVAPEGGLSGDPSFAPVYLPQQNSALPEPVDGGAASSAPAASAGTPKGNHVPQWVVKYVPITPVIPR